MTDSPMARFGLWVCAIFFCVGGNFSLFPAATATIFGTKYAGPNYGLVFTSTILAGVSGSAVMAWAYHKFGWQHATWIFAGLSAVSALLGVVFKEEGARSTK